MLTLIVAVLFGLVIALFAMQNTNGVTVSVAQYQFAQIPLYIIMIGSLLVGLVIAWFMTLLTGISSFFHMQGKEHAIKNADKTIQKLQEQVSLLKEENAVLKGNTYTSDANNEEERENHGDTHRPNIFQKVKYSLH